jgi:hypothetical protein
LAGPRSLSEVQTPYCGVLQPNRVRSDPCQWGGQKQYKVDRLLVLLAHSFFFIQLFSSRPFDCSTLGTHRDPEIRAFADANEEREGFDLFASSSFVVVPCVFCS